jgi:hypothetical protein
MILLRWNTYFCVSGGLGTRSSIAELRAVFVAMDYNETLAGDGK